MAEIQKKASASRYTKPRNSCFLCCFGFSRKKEFSEKISVKVAHAQSNNTKKETTGLFCWSRFRMSNSSVKTVPIDNSTEKAATHQPQTKIHSSKSKSKWKFYRLIFTKRQYPITKTASFHEIPTVVKVSPDQAPVPVPVPVPVPAPASAPKEIHEVEETRHRPELNIILENRKSFDHAADSSKDNTCQKRLSFRRKIDTIRTGSIQPGSPDDKPKPRRNAAKLSHSVSMPAPKREKRAAKSSSQTRAMPKKIDQNDNVIMVNKFDPIVGMSIIMVTLIIMIIWGRLCAILCTSAWFYFVPRLRTAINDDDVMMKINGDPDLNSEEYKKRVVLEGFLERDHRAG